jgi:hypothetical protein
VFTGVALLGEEQPAVKLRAPIPKAVFADGREVPPETDLRPWVEMMAAVAQAFSAQARTPARRSLVYLGKEYSAEVLRFSDMTPVPGTTPGTTAMNPELQAKLSALGLTPEQMQGVAALCGQMNAPPAPPAPPPPPVPGATMSDPTKDDPGAKLMAAVTALSEKFTAFADAQGKINDENAKQFGALKAFAEGEQKKDEEVKMAAFSAQVDAVYNRNDNKTRLTPHEWQAKRQLGLDILASKTFAAESDRAKAFDDWGKSIDALPVNPACQSVIDDSKSNTIGLTPELTTAYQLSDLGKRALAGIQARQAQQAAAAGTKAA